MKAKFIRSLLAFTALTLICNGACAMAEEIPVTPAEAQTSTPEATATTEVSAAPTATEAATATVEPTATIESTVAVDPSATVEPSATVDPSATVEPSATLEPSATVEPSASTAPTDTPSPSEMPADPNAPVIAIAGLMPGEDGSYTISPMMMQQLEISWNCAIADASYSAYVLYTDAQGAQARLDLFAGSVDSIYTWQLSGMAEGSYRLFIGARAPGAADDAILWSSITLEITGQAHGGMGGWGGGGLRGGMSGGMAGAADGEMAEDTGFKVTPGEALTDTHSSGSKITTLFGAVELVVADEASDQLIIGGKTLAITLYQNDAPASFHAEISDESLILKSVAGDACSWRINGSALKTLRKSNLQQLSLDNGTVQLHLSLENLLDGEVYKRLCEAGIVSSDYNFEFVQIGGEWSCSVRVEDVNYTLDTDSAQALYLTQAAVRVD